MADRRAPPPRFCDRFSSCTPALSFLPDFPGVFAERRPRAKNEKHRGREEGARDMRQYTGHQRAILLAILLAGLAGPARAADPALIAAAQKEGQVVWYTTQIISQLVRPMIAGFEKRYSGIKIDAVRANATDTAIKLLNEGKAGRTQADMFDGTSTVVPLKQAGLVMRYVPDSAKALP